MKIIFVCLFFFSCSLCWANPAPQVCHKDNCVSLEVVSKEDDLERGLMYRKGLEKDHGMLFVFTDDDLHQFWMKNMSFDLDMVWISNDDKIVYIGQNIPACKEDPCAIYTPDSPSRYVLEISSGYTALHSWKVGDKLHFLGL